MSPEAGPFAPTGKGGTRIRVKVVPGASRTALAGIQGDRLCVRVAAPPEKGKANRAVLALLAARLGVARSALAIVRGRTSPRKTVVVEGLGPAEVARRLGPQAAGPSRTAGAG